MLPTEPLEGLIAAPLTPLADDGAINLAVVEPYAHFLHANGVSGAFVNGTTGEGLSLSTPERQALAERWVDVAPPGFKVLVHVGHTSLEETRALAAHAQEIGAHGTGAVGPLFFKPGSAGILAEHCAREAAAAPDLPYYYYHIPSMSGVELPMLALLRAVDALGIPNFAGVKYTFETLMDFEGCRQFAGGKYDMVWGRDEMLIAALAMGTRAAIGSTYNVAAPLYHELGAAVHAGDLETAADRQRQSMRFIRVLWGPGKFIATLKHVLGGLLGQCLGPVRSPLRPLTLAEARTVDAELEEIEFTRFASVAE